MQWTRRNSGDYVEGKVRKGEELREGKMEDGGSKKGLGGEC